MSHSSTSLSSLNLRNHYRRDHGRFRSGTTTEAMLETSLLGRHSISVLQTPPRPLSMMILKPKITGIPFPATSRAPFHCLTEHTRVEESPSQFAFESTRTQNGLGPMTTSTSKMVNLSFNPLSTLTFLAHLLLKSTMAGRSGRPQAMLPTLDCILSNQPNLFLHQQKAMPNLNHSS